MPAGFKAKEIFEQKMLYKKADFIDTNNYIWYNEALKLCSEVNLGFIEKNKRLKEQNTTKKAPEYERRLYAH